MKNLKKVKEDIQKFGLSPFEIFPLQFAEMINVRLRIKSDINGELYNDNKSINSPKLKTAVQFLGIELKRIIFCVSKDYPKYCSSFGRMYLPATEDEKKIWQEHIYVLEAAFEIIKKSRPDFDWSEGQLYCLHDNVDFGCGE